MKKSRIVSGSVRRIFPIMAAGEWALEEEIQIEVICHWCYRKPTFSLPRYDIDGDKISPEFWSAQYRVYVREGNGMWLQYNGQQQLGHIVAAVYGLAGETAKRSIYRRWTQTQEYLDHFAPKFEFDGSRGTHRT